MIKKIEDIEQAVNLASNQPLCMFNTLSTVFLGKTKIPENFSELRWARYFSDKNEIRFTGCEDGIKAFIVDDEGLEYFDRMYETNNIRFGKSITVRYYLDYDADGQAFISASRLLSAEV